MPVMIAATVPTATLVLFAIGVSDRIRHVVVRGWMVHLAGALAVMWTGAVHVSARAVRRFHEWAQKRWPGEPPSDRLQTDALLFLALAVPLAVFLLPRTPIFGGTKHWMTAYPALAIFAGRGFDLVAEKLEAILRAKTKWDHEKRALVVALAGALTFGGAFAVTRHSHPFGLSTYVPFFGGTAGGADLGLNRQFWGFTTQSLAAYFKKNGKPGDAVYIMDTAWPSWNRMVAEERIPPWLRGVGSPAEAEFALVHHEQHINEVDYNIWTEYGAAAPDFVLTHDGVPIISVYRRSHGRFRR
jgi:hypothetical protein